MTDLRTAAQQALEALAIGQDAAHEVAQTYHEAMAGYRPARHIAVDDDVRKIDAAITSLKAALAEPVQEPKPVAWMHVPYPGNAISPMLSLSKHREPSMYVASVPLYLKEQL